MDYTASQFWFNVVQSLVVSVLAIYTWVVVRTKANRTAIDAVNERVAGQFATIVERVTMLERDVQHLPGHGDIEKLHEKVNAIAGAVGRIEGELTGLHSSMTLIHEHLLERRHDD
ncbi:MAG: DUF2730 family protein [Gammaproteobacteria bacterium]|nr:DUF2730 family protein [Gammaproteobacteria bacterium]